MCMTLAPLTMHKKASPCCPQDFVGYSMRNAPPIKSALHTLHILQVVDWQVVPIAACYDAACLDSSPATLLTHSMFVVQNHYPERLGTVSAVECVLAAVCLLAAVKPVDDWSSLVSTCRRPLHICRQPSSPSHGRPFTRSWTQPLAIRSAPCVLCGCYLNSRQAVIKTTLTHFSSDCLHFD